MEEKPEKKPVDQSKNSSMAPESNFPETEPTLTTSQSFYKNKAILAGIIILVSVAIAAGAYFYFSQKVSKSLSKNPIPTPSLASKYADKKPDFVIAKIGEENIYKKDLDTELAVYPKSVPADQATKIILDKIVSDSIVLQEGQKEKLITLDKTVYNSLDKDYGKRVKLAAKARSALTQNVDNISGTVVAMWFFATPLSKKPADYEATKQLAQQKMSKLQKDVKSGAITIQQAVNTIKADSSWAKYDRNYQVNASTKFQKTFGQKITFDDNFNKILWGLQPGEVSDLQLIQDTTYDTREKVDAVYMFGQVNSKKVSGKNMDFETWLASLKKVYEITYY